MPPLSPSSETKSRLKAFQFEGPKEFVGDLGHRPNVSEENKENETVTRAERTSAGLISPPARVPLSQRSIGKESKDCPQTPLGRLPLSQLLANGDDGCQNVVSTPLERVLWENSPIAGKVSNSGRRRKRKRAHSASPPSASQSEAQGSINDGRVPKDTVSVQKALETPQADPADDLWNRYSVCARDARCSSAVATLPYPGHLHSSSPQSAASLPRDGSLRRALSCIEWPTSAAKRRKMHHNRHERKSAAAFADPHGSHAKPNVSRVSLLVEKMHSGLSRPYGDPTLSSSEPAHSSPTAFGKDVQGNAVTSSQSADQDMEDVVHRISQTMMDVEASPRAPSPRSKNRIGSTCVEEGFSDEFGDADLEDDMLEAVRSDTCTIVQHDQGPQRELEISAAAGQQCNAELKVTHKGLADCEPIKAEVYRGEDIRSASHSAQHQSAPHSDSEFDDDVAEDFAADLEEVFMKYDAQISSSDKAQSKKNQEQSKDFQSEQDLLPTKPVAPPEEVSSEDDDVFGNDSDFEQLVAECTDATQGGKSLGHPQHPHVRKDKNLQRFIIKAVAAGQHEVGGGKNEPEKILSVQCETTKMSKVVALRQAWIDTPCKPGFHVNVLGTFDRYGQCVIDNVQNILILHPDHLISSTVVGDSFTCIRKAVLQDRVKATTAANQGVVYGQILHEIFQAALTANRWDDNYMAALIDDIALKHLEALFEINIEHDMAVNQLKARVTDLQAWAEIFVSAKPKPNAVIQDRNGSHALMSINKLLEVEEHIWAPTFGLKGNIDATVQICLEGDDEEKTLTVPFELKTGKHASAAHKAQTSLYSLLLSDRYDIDIACGILYYMQSSEISSIRTIRHELVPMLIQRNEIANYVRQRTELPTMLQRPYTCGKCYAKTPCFLYHKLVDDGNGETSAMGEKFDDIVGHLNTEHQQFFSKWDDLLTKEEDDIIKVRKELWTMQSEEREKVGRCFGGLIVEPGSFQLVEDSSKINRFKYTLVKQSPTTGFTFAESQLVLGEPVVVSDENGHFALANGYVTGVRKRQIQVTVDRRLHNARSRKEGFDAEKNQVFSGVMQVIDEGGKQSTSTPPQLNDPVVYRLDKDEFSNGMALVRNNLVRLMEKDVFGVQALRRLIVEGVPPSFKPVATAFELGKTASQAQLNVDQRAAIEKVMSAKDYALVLGMPGTGKTTTIAHIIRALVEQGKSVLLTSYTHTAVDNILLKLRDDGIGIFRLGATAKIHPEVQEFADLAGRSIKTAEELKRCYTQKVVATTCLGISHAIFNQRIFDYCIVDEASQITLPVCLGPIRMARTFILVGDHNQLPPLVQNQAALEGGLDVSLFRTLSEKHPQAVVNLEHQYRMCEDIQTLSNRLIYEGRLKCGTENVAISELSIPSIDALEKHHHTDQSILSKNIRHACSGPYTGACWIRDLLDPSRKACFVNTDQLVPDSREVLEHGSRITNPCEVSLTCQLVEAFLTVGIKATDLGIITLYRSQLALLKRSLRHRAGIEMHTADKFQGRDKEIIILSLVRSNEQQTIGDLLKDWRRVNVALTRARTKLLILGSRDTLVSNNLLKELIGLMETRHWIYKLPGRARDGHVFEEAETQVSGDINLNTNSHSFRSPIKGKGSPNEALGIGKENIKGRRRPTKQARLDANVVLKRRPVLKDIVNDAS